MGRCHSIHWLVRTDCWGALGYKQDPQTILQDKSQESSICLTHDCSSVYRVVSGSSFCSRERIALEPFEILSPRSQELLKPFQRVHYTAQSPDICFLQWGSGKWVA